MISRPKKENIFLQILKKIAQAVGLESTIVAFIVSLPILYTLKKIYDGRRLRLPEPTPKPTSQTLVVSKKTPSIASTTAKVMKVAVPKNATSKRVTFCNEVQVLPLPPKTINPKQTVVQPKQESHAITQPRSILRKPGAA